MLIIEDNNFMRLVKIKEKFFNTISECSPKDCFSILKTNNL